MRALAADVATKEAEATQKGSDAQLKQAKTQKELASIGQDTGQQEVAMEQQKLEAEMAMEQQKMDQEFALKKEQMEREFALKREQMAAEMQLKREQAAADTARRSQWLMRAKPSVRARKDPRPKRSPTRK